MIIKLCISLLKLANSLDAVKRNRGFINAEHPDFTTLHQVYWLRIRPIQKIRLI